MPVKFGVNDPGVNPTDDSARVSGPYRPAKQVAATTNVAHVVGKGGVKQRRAQARQVRLRK